MNAPLASFVLTVAITSLGLETGRAAESPIRDRIAYATYLGGNGDDLSRSLALGPRREVFLFGNTSSDDFPVTESALQETHAGQGDAFVVKLELVGGP
jgi:hypothetical protein